MDIINYAYKNTNISYIGVNFHIRYCKDCGETILSSESKCHKCNSRDIQGVSRVTGYLVIMKIWANVNSKKEMIEIHTEAIKIIKNYKLI